MQRSRSDQAIAPELRFPVTVARHILRLQARIEGIAETASVRGTTGVNLDDTLAALDPRGRRRVTMVLELVKAFSNDPDERTAADHIRMRAARVVRAVRQLLREPWRRSPDRPPLGYLHSRPPSAWAGMRTTAAASHHSRGKEAFMTQSAPMSSGSTIPSSSAKLLRPRFTRLLIVPTAAPQICAVSS